MRLLRDFASLFVVSDLRVRSPHAMPYADHRTLWLLALLVGVGTLLRFWGLGAVGLHGDEKTMALPVMNLVEHGLPLMPSGMFYPRAVGQLYLMAASVLVFGQSEWALRFPSAVCGVLLILLTWKVGQRFLTPRWNLALTAAVALLPSFLDDSQTARMYVFLVTCVAGYMALLFEWERSGRVGYLVGAVVTLVVGIQFHTLAIFAAFLVLMPGLLQGDARKLWAGVVAFAVIAAGFEVINTLIGHAYPQSTEADAGPVGNGPHAALVPRLAHLWLVVAALPALLLAWWVARPAAGARAPGVGADAGVGAVAGGGAAAGVGAAAGGDVLAGVGAAAGGGAVAGGGAAAAGDAPAGGGAAARGRAASAVAVVLLAGALVAGVALAWHLAVLLAAVGLVFARRVGELRLGRVAVFLGVSALVAVAEAVFLVQHAAGSPKQIVGVLLGWPSVWPFIAIADYSVLVMLAATGALASALWLLAHRKPVPDHILLLVLGVWVPLLMIGLMKWNIPARYAAAQVMPLLVCGFAAMQWAASWVARSGWLAAGEVRVDRAPVAGVARRDWSAAGEVRMEDAPVAGVVRRGWLAAGEVRRDGAPVARVGVPPPGGAGAASAPAAAWASWVAAAACVVVVNPVALVDEVGAGYAIHPDHKGAAEFVESLHPGPRDIIVAEDVLQQTYYLGHVDYWLVNKQVAAPFMHRVNGRLLDFYTDTPLIGSGSELEALVEKSNRGTIYVIGSGENQEDGRSLMRAFGIAEALQSPRFQLIYRGRDGFTRVWKVDPPGAAVAQGQLSVRAR